MEKLKHTDTNLDTNLEPTMSNLANSKVILKCYNSALEQKSSSSLYSNFILNLHIVYKLKNWPPNLTNNFTNLTSKFVRYSQIGKKRNQTIFNS